MAPSILLIPHCHAATRRASLFRRASHLFFAFRTLYYRAAAIFYAAFMRLLAKPMMLSAYELIYEPRNQMMARRIRLLPILRARKTDCR